MKLNFQLKLGKTSVFFNTFSMRTPDTPTVGFASRVSGTCLHVQFLDYDYYTYADLLDVLKFLQDWFKQSSYYVFTTSDTKKTLEEIKSSDAAMGFHAVCLDMKTLHDTMEIVMSSDCDMAFEKAVRLYKYRNWVLRAFEKGQRCKPRFLEVIRSAYAIYPQSLWHAQFMSVNYGVDYKSYIKRPFPRTIEKLSPRIRLADYTTGNRVCAENV